ncbi:MAG: hypothetical protein F6K26_39855 [Moorea sp. SIO2I5]|nr:hypothetical protein [Moorena sp. SIO2I5]
MGRWGSLGRWVRPEMKRARCPFHPRCPFHLPAQTNPDSRFPIPDSRFANARMRIRAFSILNSKFSILNSNQD